MARCRSDEHHDVIGVDEVLVVGLGTTLLHSDAARASTSRRAVPGAMTMTKPDRHLVLAWAQFRTSPVIEQPENQP